MTMDRRKLAAQYAFDRKHRRAMMGDFVLEDLHEYRINRHSFTIYVGSDPLNVAGPEDGEIGVEHNMADRLAMNLSVLTGINRTRPILIELASCGGNWDEGMQMFGSILTCPNPITVMATKWARSMTSLIPLAADRFVIRPPAQYMFHHGTFSANGLVQEAVTDYRELLSTRETMLRIYATRLREQGRHSKMSEYRIKTMLMEEMRQDIDVWMSADEAVARGFADEVFTGNFDTLRAKRKNLIRRERMMATLRRPVKVEIKVS